MSFEYNENLELMSRIKLVREEIKKQYPLIDNMAAVMSATLSPTVDDKPTNSERFERYYFILLIIIFIFYFIIYIIIIIHFIFFIHRIIQKLIFIIIHV